MSVFLLPKTLCKDINITMAKFWWGHKGNDLKMAWMSWEKMGRGKERGGLGFRDLECFSLASLAKQGWHLIHNPDTLVAKVFGEKYFAEGSFLASSLWKRPSYSWRSIWASKKLLQAGMMWRVGDRKSIKIWKDRWIPSPTTFAIQSLIVILDSEARVSMLIDEETKWWNQVLVRTIFRRKEADLICSLANCPRLQSDWLVWARSKNGDFSIRSAYHFAKGMVEGSIGSSSSLEQDSKMWKMIWNIRGRLGKT